MAINPDDFIFHSDLTPRQRVFTSTATVNISGTLGAGAYAIGQTAWIDTGSTLQDIEVYATVSGPVYSPNTTGSTFQTPVELNITSDLGMSALVYTIQSGNNIRCLVGVFNGYDTSATIPSKTITFTIKGYLPPAI